MEIINNFGLNPILLGAQIINFLIVLFVLKKFLYKPILDILNKRQITIKEGLKQAEDARIKLEKVVIEEKEILRQAQFQARKIMEDAKDKSAELARKMSDDTKSQAEKLLSDTKKQIANESKLAEKKLAVKSGELAVAILEKALRDFFSPKDQKVIISQALKRVKKLN